jgi:predicted PurR-regulated permease PerM
VPIQDYRLRRRIILTLTIGLGIFLLYALRELFPAFLGAVVLYVLFRPFFGYLRINRKWPNWLATWTIMLMTFLLLVLPLLTVGMMIGNKVTLLLNHTEAITSIIDRVQHFFGVNVNDDVAVEKLLSFLQENLFGGVSSFLNGVFGLIFTLGMMYFMLYFMLSSHRSFERTLLKYMPFQRDNSLRFAAELRSSTYSNVLGQGLIAFVQGSLVSVGFWIFDFNDPVFWGIISFFLSFLPVIGAPIVFVPAGLIAIASGQSSDGYGIILWGFILVTNIDNVLRFFISRYMADTHPLVTIIGVIIGIPVFGILGLVFGPLIISWFFLLLKIYEEGKDEGEEEEEDEELNSITN